MFLYVKFRKANHSKAFQDILHLSVMGLIKRLESNWWFLASHECKCAMLSYLWYNLVRKDFSSVILTYFCNFETRQRSKYRESSFVYLLVVAFLNFLERDILILMTSWFYVWRECFIYSDQKRSEFYGICSYWDAYTSFVKMFIHSEQIIYGSHISWIYTFTSWNYTVQTDYLNCTAYVGYELF